MKTLASRPAETSSVDKDPASQDSSASGFEADLSATVGAFETRFQRKKREKEESVNIMSVEARKRQALMLETMANIRRSLVKVARIDLGERFSFSMDFDDWQGWPRLLIKLNDATLPEADYPTFQVLAHDRSNKATIEINCPALVKPERILIHQSSDLARLPTALKKCVRQFLDLVEQVILDAESALVDESLPSKDEPVKQAAGDGEDSSLSGDLFSDGEYTEDFLDKLPPMDELETISESGLPDEG